MKKEVESAEVVNTPSTETEYAAPKIEKVITKDDMNREVHYAGATDGVSVNT